MLKLTEFVSQFVANRLGLGDVGKFETSFLPTSERYQELIKEGIGDYLTREADTGLGRMIQRPIELATGSVGVAAPISKALQTIGKNIPRGGAITTPDATKEAAKLAAASGLAGQGVREFYDGDMGDAYGTGVELVTSLGRTASNVRPEYAAREASKIIDEAKQVDPGLASARAREATAQEQGLALTVPEALDSPAATTATGNILAQPEAAARFGLNKIRQNRMGDENNPSVVQRSVRQMIGRRYEPEDFVARVRDTSKEILLARSGRLTRETEDFFVAGQKTSLRPKTLKLLSGVLMMRLRAMALLTIPLQTHFKISEITSLKLRFQRVRMFFRVLQPKKHSWVMQALSTIFIAAPVIVWTYLAQI